MRLSSFSAAFNDYELDLDYYHGKDLVHQGNLLKIDPEYSWERINGKIRNKIRKAQKLNARIERVSGTAEDIARFRTIWFDPTDDTIPSSLEDDEVMYLTYLDDELVGGLILTPSTPTVLYMHNLGSNETGKRQNIPALTLWHAVEDLQGSGWQYIDVGVSFRPTLYAFFKNWQTDSYPITFSPPFIVPDIRLTPFDARDIAVYKNDASEEAHATVREYFGDTYTILPRAIYCLKAVLTHLDLKQADTVAVYKTYNDNDYISGCVTKPIEAFCTVAREITDTTKAVLVIHEFGIPYPQTMELKKICQERGIPLIEDCAWGYGSEIEPGTAIGQAGDYAIYSLPKFTPLQYGAVLTGLSISDEDNWSNYRMLDYFKRELVYQQLHTELTQLDASNQRRRQNWEYLAKLFKQDGFETMAALPDTVYPGALIVKLPDMQAVYERYTSFGVETARYYQEEALCLPVHQRLTENQLDYIYGVFRGKLNLSSNYRRDGKKG